MEECLKLPRRWGVEGRLGTARVMTAARRLRQAVSAHWPELHLGRAALEGGVHEQPREDAVVAVAVGGVDLRPRLPPRRPRRRLHSQGFAAVVGGVWADYLCVTPKRSIRRQGPGWRGLHPWLVVEGGKVRVRGARAAPPAGGGGRFGREERLLPGREGLHRQRVRCAVLEGTKTSI